MKTARTGDRETRRSNKHPLQPGAVVFPRQWENNPLRGSHLALEGRATITGPGNAPHHYLVTFEGETVPCERGPLDESSLRDPSSLSELPRTREVAV